MNGIGASVKRAVRCLIPITFLMVSSVAYAQNNASSVHPVIGDKPPKELLASDILALPEREQQAWIHGAIISTIQTTSSFNKDKAGCISGWYFDGNGAQVIVQALNAYKDAYASSIVFAAANNVCKNA